MALPKNAPPVMLGIGVDVKHNPQRENGKRRYTQRMMMKKAFIFSARCFSH
jgi:hypothetical protein